MKILSTIWWVIRNRKYFYVIKDEGVDVYEAVKSALMDKKITKSEAKIVLLETLDFFEAFKPLLGVK